MTHQDIDATAQEFADAAKLAHEAGFDAVEIHLGHGYLLSQFISPLLNKRNDAFGGSLVNRLRFPCLVIERIRAALGENFPILGKLNVSDGCEGGVVAQDAAHAAQLLEKSGISALVLSGGLVDRSALFLLRGERPLKQMIEVEKNKLQRFALRVLGKKLVRAYPFEPLFFLEEAREVRKAVRIPLVLLGGISSLADIERALAEGFDFVAMGRALIHDPHLIAAYRSGEATCSGCEPCNQCIAEMDRPGGVCCARQPKQLAQRAHAVSQRSHEKLC